MNLKSSAVAILVAAAALGAMPAHAAKVVMRLHEDDGQYSGFPDSYPVCKSKMDYMHYDGTPTLAKRNLFDTKTGWIEIGVYAVGGVFNGTEVLNRLRTYESNDMEVAGVSLYREDWLATDTPGGAFPIDWRILSATEIAAVRNAIATADPPLRCKDTLKIIQLLGAGSGAWGAGSAQNFPIFSQEVKEHLKLFDGLGVECHIGDHEPGQRRGVITAMAAISKWAADNAKTTFVFMGGGAGTYENLPRTQLTYRFLWNEMFKLGVNYRSDDIVYFRQGAWGGGKHTPESAYNTLTHQQRWVINTLKPEPGATPTSLFVSEVQNRNIGVDTMATIPFYVGEAEMDADLLAVSATSSNQALVSNANLKINGRGLERVLLATPSPLQTGTTTITLTVNDGTVSMSTSFQLTVSPSNDFTAAATGSINDPVTWGIPIPVVGDSDIWRTGNKIINMTALTGDTFHGGTFEVETGGQLTPGVPFAKLGLNKLVLNGGTISATNNGGFDIDLAENQFLLNSGTLKSGVSSAMGVRFQNGVLAGNGTVNITSAGTGGGEIQFQDLIHTPGFTGKFNVSTNGTLNLPLIPADNASFGLILSGTGRYANDEDVSLTSLMIAGVSIPAGDYAYDDFSTAQKAFLVNQSGTITVISNTPPTLGVMADQVTDEDSPISFSFNIGDAQSTAGALTVSGFSSDTNLVPNSNFAFSGSGANRNVTITPAVDKHGASTITLIVSDGWFKTTRTFNLTVNSINDAPVISAINNQTTPENHPVSIPFTANDAETSAEALIITTSSSNTSLVPNSNIILGGFPSNRSLEITPTAIQNGETTVTLSVSDGVNTTTRTFLLTVVPANTVIAALAGNINDAATWGVTPPISGDSFIWRTGSQSLRMATATETFYGNTFVVDSGGQFAPGLASAVLTLNHVVLNGGIITTGNNLALIMDLSGGVLTLKSGTLRAGGTNSGRDVRFRNGSLSGNSTIAITAGTYVATDPPDVEFQADIATKGFTGVFEVSQNGVLNLPPISSANASFGMALSGTGRYTNDAAVALVSLVIDGTPVAPGIYAHADFSTAQQAFLVKTTGIITVLNSPPTISAVSDPLPIGPNTSSSPIPFTIGDAETPATLAVTAITDNPALFPQANIALSGSGADRTVTITPAANQIGSATVTLTVNDGLTNASETFQFSVTGSALENWRFDHFGSTAETINSANTADSNGDGENNLLEFSTGQSPQAGTRAAVSLTSDFDFTYVRSITAHSSGIAYAVQWSDTLAPDSWSSAGVIEEIFSTQGDLQTVRATLPPQAGSCFARLQVTAPGG
jgi:hypothetical protein